MNNISYFYNFNFQYGTHHIIDENIKAGHSIKVVYLCGGLRKNPMFVQTHADVTGKLICTRLNALFSLSIKHVSILNVYSCNLPNFHKFCTNQCTPPMITLLHFMPPTSLKKLWHFALQVFVSPYVILSQLVWLLNLKLSTQIHISMLMVLDRSVLKV